MEIFYSFKSQIADISKVCKKEKVQKNLNVQILTSTIFTMKDEKLSTLLTKKFRGGFLIDSVSNGHFLKIKLVVRKSQQKIQE